jgi:hypothetical protein
MAKKLGFSWSNKRDREIFGPSWGRMMLIVGISAVLIILLMWMFSGEEDGAEDAVEYIEEETAEEEEPPLVGDAELPEPEAAIEEAATVSGECPLPSIPIVDIQESELFGDTDQDAGLSEGCRALVDESKRRLSKLFADAKNDEQDVADAERRLADAIMDLEEALGKLYQEQENLDEARACVEETEEDAAAPETEQETTPAGSEEQQIVR